MSLESIKIKPSTILKTAGLPWTGRSAYSPFSWTLFILPSLPSPHSYRLFFAIDPPCATSMPPFSPLLRCSTPSPWAAMQLLAILSRAVSIFTFSPSSLIACCSPHHQQWKWGHDQGETILRCRFSLPRPFCHHRYFSLSTILAFPSSSSAIVPLSPSLSSNPTPRRKSGDQMASNKADQDWDMIRLWLSDLRWSLGFWSKSNNQNQFQSQIQIGEGFRL